MLKATLVDRIEDAQDIPGAIEIRHCGLSSGIAFICPCGCGIESYLPIGPNGWMYAGGVVGKPDEITLHPSVLNPCKWHGHLRAGVWEACS